MDQTCNIQSEDVRKQIQLLNENLGQPVQINKKREKIFCQGL